jgi:type IV secretion system protein VirD4
MIGAFMSGNRILWGQITLVLAVVLATTWTATQWTAWRLGFQPQLGQPWFELALGVPVYYPPAFFWWWYAYDAYAPSVFVEGALIAASGGFIAIAVAITLSILRAREAKNVETYGSARTVSSSAAMPSTICAMTDRSTFCALHRQDRVKASAWWSRRC